MIRRQVEEDRHVRPEGHDRLQLEARQFRHHPVRRAEGRDHLTERRPDVAGHHHRKFAASSIVPRRLVVVLLPFVPVIPRKRRT